MLQHVQETLAALEQAKREAELAVQAQIPGADAALKHVEDLIQKAQTFKNVYFPGGVVNQ